MSIKKILWLEDQYEDFSAFRGALFRAGFMVDPVESVSEAEEKLRQEGDYIAYIFDIKVLPGDDKKWRDFDERRRAENPDFDPYLGLELLKSLFNRQNKDGVKLAPPVVIKASKVIVFSVVYDKSEEIHEIGVPEDQILYKAACDLSTLPQLIKQIVEKVDGQ
jgi:hypothetical protein